MARHGSDEKKKVPMPEKDSPPTFPPLTIKKLFFFHRFSAVAVPTVAIAVVFCIRYHACMQIVGRKNFMLRYHVGTYVVDELIEQGMPVRCEKVPGVPNVPMVCDSDEVDEWLKNSGINLAKKSGRRSVAGRYITVEQAKNMFPHDPAMALLYAILCTKEDYLKHFRRIA